MNVLIVYGTIEGQTRKIAKRAGMRVRDRSHEVELCDSASLAPALDVGAFHAIIIAASVHQERHQETISNFVIAHREQLNSKPTAFISVSLSAVLEYAKDEAQSYVVRFLATTHWRPQRILLLGGALRASEYDYFQRQIVKFIVMKRGETLDMDRDYEFTDWNVLAGFIDVFLAVVTKGAVEAIIDWCGEFPDAERLRKAADKAGNDGARTIAVGIEQGGIRRIAGAVFLADPPRSDSRK